LVDITPKGFGVTTGSDVFRRRSLHEVLIFGVAKVCALDPLCIVGLVDFGTSVPSRIVTASTTSSSQGSLGSNWPLMSLSLRRAVPPPGYAFCLVFFKTLSILSKTSHLSHSL